MTGPKQISIADFDYPLPDDRIAKYPLAERDASKLLLYSHGDITESRFFRLAEHLPEQAMLVFNNSKVIQSRLLFTKPSGGQIEVFILEPTAAHGDISTAMRSEGTITCHCLVGGAKKWKQGKLQIIVSQANGEEHRLTAEVVDKQAEAFIIRFEWTPSTDFATALETFGATPIPPYLHRSSELSDKERYQTIYAKENGSVAAPTAGLHFTPRVMQTLKDGNIQDAYVTLHVGAGTFKPVKSDTMEGHEMHAEYIDVDIRLMDRLIYSNCIIPVGTTSMRTLESLYWMGVKTLLRKQIELQELEVGQWEVYDELRHHDIPKEDALKALMEWMRERGMERLVLKTQIMIAPGYTFRMIKGLITNFHQPRSTLLLLIAAMVGDDWKRIYGYAMEHEFRFLSYGDSSLLLL